MLRMEPKRWSCAPCGGKGQVEPQAPQAPEGFWESVGLTLFTLNQIIVPESKTDDLSFDSTVSPKKNKSPCLW